jgi:Tfp pilus assembly protein PilP
MRLTTGILVAGLMAGIAGAQNPDAIDNTRYTLQNLQKKQAIDQNAALAVAGQAAAPAVQGQPSHVAAPVPVKAPAPTTGSASKAVAPGTQHESKTVVAVKPPETPKPEVAVEDKKAPEDSTKKEPKEYSAAGRRDPFVSPVVSHITAGSGCSTGKRCLSVDQIILTGIVKSESGMIAVVMNGMNKAYFLRENDPVFNGYVVKITGDSVIFNQTIEDKLGKPFTHEVTKRIATPAV